MSNKKSNKQNQPENQESQENQIKLVYDDFSDVPDQELIKEEELVFNFGCWVDFDDVCQIIRAHIHKKWDQWDQSRPIKPWLNKIIANQTKTSA